MEGILRHFETMVETIVCWYLQGNRNIPEFLRRPGPAPPKKPLSPTSKIPSAVTKKPLLGVLVGTEPTETDSLDTRLDEASGSGRTVGVGNVPLHRAQPASGSLARGVGSAILLENRKDHQSCSIHCQRMSNQSPTTNLGKANPKPGKRDMLCDSSTWLQPRALQNRTRGERIRRQFLGRKGRG